MSDIEEIKNRLDIVDVVSDYTKLQKAGANFRANCPFHNEKTPSFFVSPSRQTWHCFGSCNEGGDIFTFVQKIDGIEFVDALKLLADKAGVQLKKIDPKLKNEKTKISEIIEEAAKFYEKNLKNVKPAVDYLLKDRGILLETIKEFRIGFSPARSNEIFKHLSQLGYKSEEIEKTGLVIKSDRDNSYFDRFRSRIMFPIKDLNGSVVGFGGRIFKLPEVSYKSEMAKYINTPETVLYNKSRTLYNLDKAKIDLRKNDKCVLVEGYFDAIASYQAGVKNVVAVSGTALTENHLQIIKRYTSNILSSFDTDLAGQNATRRGIDMAQKMDFNVKVIKISGGKDPADIVKEDAAKWRSAIENSIDIMDFYIAIAFENNDSKSADGKKSIINLILPVIKNIARPTMQNYWIKILSKKLTIDEEALRIEMNKIQDNPIDNIIDITASADDAVRILKIEEVLLGFLALYPDCFKFINEKNFTPSQENSEIFKLLKESIFNFKPNDFLKKLTANQSSKINHAIFQAEIAKTRDIDQEREIKDCLEKHFDLVNKIKRKKIEERLMIAEERGDHKEAEKLAREYNEIVKKSD